MGLIVRDHFCLNCEHPPLSSRTAPHQKAAKSIHAQNLTSPPHQWRRTECHAPFTFRASTSELLRKCALRLPICFPHVPASSIYTAI